MLETKMVKICLQTMLTMDLNNDNIDNMLQRQIVIQALGTRIGIEDLVCIKYTGTSFHSIGCMLISVNVTIHRTALIQRYQSTSHFIMLLMTTKLLRGCI